MSSVENIAANSEKWVAITGADRGVGFEFAKQYAQAGRQVIAGRYLAKESFLDGLDGGFEGRLHVLPLDVSSDWSVDSFAYALRKLTPRLDLLINNAAITGGAEPTIYEPLNTDTMLKVFNTNTLGYIRVANRLLPEVMAGGKLIVCISSEAGQIGCSWRDHEIGYCMSKAAINSAFAIIQNAIAEQGGQVMLLHPGWVRSWMGGVKNEKATYEPEESAAKLIQIIKDKELYCIGPRPAYVDLEGRLMEW